MLTKPPKAGLFVVGHVSLLESVRFFALPVHELHISV